MSIDLTRGKFGYAIEHERRLMLEDCGEDSKLLMKRFADTFPPFNVQADPTGAVKVRDQGGQGACQGFSLRTIFGICFFLATGRWAEFSPACGYYCSQFYDGIRGDKGSTLSAGQKVATVHGMCLEKDWPYPPNYSSRQPSGITFPFKLATSKPFTDSDAMIDWLKMGLPIQTGINWNDSCDVEVLDSYSNRRGGGHSTTLWQMVGENPVNINSWGQRWCQDGCQQWTKQSIDRMLKDRFTVFIGYAPDGMSFPNQEVIG